MRRRARDGDGRGNVAERGKPNHLALAACRAGPVRASDVCGRWYDTSIGTGSAYRAVQSRSVTRSRVVSWTPTAGLCGLVPGANSLDSSGERRRNKRTCTYRPNWGPGLWGSVIFWLVADRALRGARGAWALIDRARARLPPSASWARSWRWWGTRREGVGNQPTDGRARSIPFAC